MRRTVLFAAAALLGVTAAACSSTAPATPSPAQSLAAADQAGGQVSAYQAALDALAGKCTQSSDGQLAAMGDAAYGQLVAAGVKDETRLSLLQHVAASIPAGSPRLDCVGQMAAYVTLREG